MDIHPGEWILDPFLPGKMMERMEDILPVQSEMHIAPGRAETSRLQ